MIGWLRSKPKTRHAGKGAWYSEYAICPMCGDFTRPIYHGPTVACSAPSRGEDHNHLRCRCTYEWTLPPRGRVL